jgi:small subunit ribosomal protein S2
MKPYIYTERNSIHIIDLQQTVKAIEVAYKLLVDTVADEGTVLFVGTKRQAQETIQLESERCEMPYVTNRWLGGTLTNFRTIRQRINELERLERMRDRGEFSRITKKEALLLTRKMDRLEMLIGGIRNMTGLPDLLFVVDVRREDTAIHEANLLNIPVVAMVDTNCDPRTVDYVIPANDDAIRAIKLMVGKMADAVLEGMALRKEEEEFEPSERMTAMAVDEPELSDEDLLGEATLAKMAEETAAAAAAAEAAAEAAAAAQAEAEAVEGEAEVVAEETEVVVEGEEGEAEVVAEETEVVIEGEEGEAEVVAEETEVVVESEEGETEVVVEEAEAAIELEKEAAVEISEEPVEETVQVEEEIVEESEAEGTDETAEEDEG